LDKDLKFVYKQDKNAFKLEVYLDDKLLFSKFLVFLINKIDLVQDEEILEEFTKEVLNKINTLFLN
jgi:translation elongation factor EF-Tu-like GTPase